MTKKNETWRLSVLLLLLPTLAACDATSTPPVVPAPPSGDGSVVVDPDEPLDASGLRYDCVIGVADSSDDPAFRALEPGGAIPIGGQGQAGLVARMALRCAPASDVEPALSEADVELVLTNVFTAVLAPREPEPMRSTLSCQEQSCELAPITIEISHLAKLPELEGLTVRVDLRVLSSLGELLGRARSHGVLTPGG